MPVFPKIRQFQLIFQLRWVYNYNQLLRANYKMFLKPTPRLSKEGTKEILKTLYKPARASAAVKEQTKRVIALNKVLKVKEEQRAKAKKLALQ
jgi:hypothetical protein